MAKKITKSKLKDIISDSYDKVGLDPSKKDNICEKTLPFIQDLIKIGQGKKKMNEKSIELSEDLLFNGLLESL
jgi:hypothetical protein